MTQGRRSVVSRVLTADGEKCQADEGRGILRCQCEDPDKALALPDMSPEAGSTV